MLRRLLLLAVLLAAGMLVARRLRAREHAGDMFAPPASVRPAFDRSRAEPQRAAPAPEAAGDIEGYCMRCRARRTMAGVRIETTETGRRAARGTCPVCGANMYKFLPASS